MRITKKFTFKKDLLDYDPEKYDHPVDVCFYNAFSYNFPGLQDFTDYQFKGKPEDSFIFPALKSAHGVFDIDVKDNKAKITVETVNRANGMFWFLLLISMAFPLYGLLFIVYYLKADKKCDQAVIDAMDQIESELEDF